ncbi:hypothetical protein [Sulfurisphaera ohwakuensis]|uniref:hypothetical protein n=1 Tax=Sulfurisphaera ohwakuensis TaxID=69656 RepID=UPI0036F1F7C5
MERLKDIIKTLKVLNNNKTLKILFITQLIPVNFVLYYLLVGYIYFLTRNLIDLGIIAVTSISGVPSFLLPFSSAINNSIKSLKKYDLSIILVQFITLAWITFLVSTYVNSAVFLGILQGLFISLFIFREPVNLYLIKSVNLDFDVLKKLEGILASLRQINQAIIVILVILLEERYGLRVFDAGFGILLIFILLTLLLKLRLDYPAAEKTPLKISFITQFKSLKKTSNTVKLIFISDYLLYPIIAALYPVIFYLLGITDMFNVSYSLYLLFFSITMIFATYVSNIIRVRTFGNYVLVYRITIALVIVLLSYIVYLFPVFMIGVFTMLVLENSSFIYLNSFLITAIEKEKIRIIIPIMEFIFSIVYSVAVIVVSDIGTVIGELSILRYIGIIYVIVYAILFVRTRNIRMMT